MEYLLDISILKWYIYYSKVLKCIIVHVRYKKKKILITIVFARIIIHTLKFGYTTKLFSFKILFFYENILKYFILFV